MRKIPWINLGTVQMKRKGMKVFQLGTFEDSALETFLFPGTPPIFSLQSVSLKRFFDSERKGLVWITASTSNDIPGPPVQLDLLLAENCASPRE